MLNKNQAINIDIKKSISGSTYKTFIFKCNTCDKQIKAQSYQLKTHSGKCRRCSQLGIPYLHIYNELKNHHNKKIEFNLTFNEFLETINNKTCHYCSKGLIFNPYSKEHGKALTRAYQLDRKDNNKGYIKDNIVPCCWECNRLKSNIYSYKDFLKIGEILKQIEETK